MVRHRRAACGFAGAEALPPTRFVGYDLLETDATVLAHRPGQRVRGAPRRAKARPVLLDVSPFYAEAGGQVGDTGHLAWPGGTRGRPRHAAGRGERCAGA